MPLIYGQCADCSDPAMCPITCFIKRPSDPSYEKLSDHQLEQFYAENFQSNAFRELNQSSFENQLIAGIETNKDPEESLSSKEPLSKKMRDLNKSILAAAQDNYIYAIGLIAIIAIISFKIMTKIIFKRKKTKDHAEIREKFGYMESHFNNLLSYIQNNLKSGYDQQSIKSKLTEAGHNPKFIDEIFEKIINRK